MVYLSRFAIPTQAAEGATLRRSSENKRTCYGSRYPFGVFGLRRLTELELEPVTILCGGNGSGKTTLLNLMGEKLELQRGTAFNRSSFYGDYLSLCSARTAPGFDRTVRANSRIITSDDVFDYLLDFRQMNEGIGARQRELLAEYAEKRGSRMQMRSLEDLDELRRVVDAQRLSASRYVKEHGMKDLPGKSNGENAFLFFTRSIGEKGLYLLDEPENSLSPALQLELARFLEDSARFYACQFVIATHSPFLQALRGARVYDLDADPPARRRWTELDSVQTWYRFFREHQEELEDSAGPAAE